MSQRQVCVTIGEHGPEATCIRCVHEGPERLAVDRAALIARVGFIMPALTDRGLSLLFRAAERLAEDHSRDLGAATLAAEQQAREATAEQQAQWAAMAERRLTEHG